jgi:hypothetical protein
MGVINKSCVAYLVRATQEDVESLNKSLDLLEKNVSPFCSEFDILLFHEEDLEPFKDKILKRERIIYKKVSFVLPPYQQDILDEIPEFYPHPTHQNGPIAYWHKGFTMGYRHMCNFFFSGIFEYLSDYESYMRLDTDSFILSPIGYDIFEWFNSNNLSYAYIAPAIQVDNQAVCEGLNDTVSEWIDRKSIKTKINIKEIENGTLYYTNFEMCRVSSMRSEESRSFYTLINKTGRIFSKRWGDHVLRYLQVNLFFEIGEVSPVSGIHYQHGAIYNT